MIAKSGRASDTFVHAHHLPRLGVDMLHVFCTVQDQRKKSHTTQAALEGEETYASDQNECQQSRLVAQNCVSLK